MADLTHLQLTLVALLFIWSGFVRAGLGFGGVALALPLMLLILNDPVLWLPICSGHLLIFSMLSLYGRLHNVDWSFLGKAMLIIIIPKVIGVFGLVSLPANLVSGAIYLITLGYAITYILNYQFHSESRAFDRLMLVLGGYASGVSLIGAPLITAVMVRHVAFDRLRDTMFALWLVLVTIKMSTFVILDVPLQLQYMLYLLPLAAIGHYLGVKFHKRMLRSGGIAFKRVLGVALAVICLYGLVQVFW